MEEESVRSLLIRSARLAALAVVSAGISCGGCAAEDVSIAAHVAAMPSRTLQLILADHAHPEGRRWIVWDEGIGDAQTAHIALRTMAGRCDWNHTWPDAYAPTIQYMGAWSIAEMSLVLVTYNQGAEAQTAVVVELPYAQTPRILDQHDGAWIALAPGEDYLELSTASGASSSLACLRWDHASLRLRDARCRKRHAEEK